MIGLLLRWLLVALALFLTSVLIPGVHADSAGSLLVAALVLGILNAVLRPLLIILTLPINLLTLGLFTLVINGGMLKLTSMAVPGFVVSGFWSAVFGALVLSFTSFLLNLFVTDSGRIAHIRVELRS
jgi:putative membrane protein